MPSIEELVGENKIMRYVFSEALKRSPGQPAAEARSSRLDIILDPQYLLTAVYHLQRPHLRFLLRAPEVLDTIGKLETRAFAVQDARSKQFLAATLLYAAAVIHGKTS